MGDLRLLRRYERERKAALLPMGMAMDGLQQLFAAARHILLRCATGGMKGFELVDCSKEWTARRAMGTD